MSRDVQQFNDFNSTYCLARWAGSQMVMADMPFVAQCPPLRSIVPWITPFLRAFVETVQAHHAIHIHGFFPDSS
jgi:hypothetical protein